MTHLGRSERKSLTDVEMDVCIENCSVEAAWVEIGGDVAGGGDGDGDGARKFHDARLGDDGG